MLVSLVLVLFLSKCRHFFCKRKKSKQSFFTIFFFRRHWVLKISGVQWTSVASFDSDRQLQTVWMTDLWAVSSKLERRRGKWNALFIHFRKMLSLKPIHSLLYTLESAILERQNSKIVFPKGLHFYNHKMFFWFKI